MLINSSFRDMTDQRDRFADVSVLIADSDVRTSELVRRVLFSFGFRRIAMADTQEGALSQMRTEKMDLIITESRMRRGDGVSFVHTIRNLDDVQVIRRDVPVIMLTADAGKKDVLRARDAGVTEFLVKPFSAKTLSNRIVQVIDKPRLFIQAPNYAGPCRRRRSNDQAQERRKTSFQVPSDASMDADLAFSGQEGLVQLGEDNGAGIFAPNTQILDKIGHVQAADILNHAAIEEAQDVLLCAETEFISWAKDDIAKLDAAYEELLARPGDPMAHQLLLSSAYAICSQAGIFGYELGARIGKMLVQYMHYNPVMDTNRLLVVHKHIEAIKVVFSQRIKHAQQVGQELVASLAVLTEKMG